MVSSDDGKVLKERILEVIDEPNGPQNIRRNEALVILLGKLVLL